MLLHTFQEVRFSLIQVGAAWQKCRIGRLSDIHIRISGLEGCGVYFSSDQAHVSKIIEQVCQRILPANLEVCAALWACNLAVSRL